MATKLRQRRSCLAWQPVTHISRHFPLRHCGMRTVARSGSCSQATHAITASWNFVLGAPNRWFGRISYQKAVMTSDTGAIWFLRNENTRVFLDHLLLKFISSFFLFSEGKKSLTTCHLKFMSKGHKLSSYRLRGRDWWVSCKPRDSSEIWRIRLYSLRFFRVVNWFR